MNILNWNASFGEVHMKQTMTKTMMKRFKKMARMLKVRMETETETIDGDSPPNLGVYAL